MSERRYDTSKVCRFEVDRLLTIPEGEIATDAYLKSHEWGWGDLSVCCRELAKLRKIVKSIPEYAHWYEP